MEHIIRYTEFSDPTLAFRLARNDTGKDTAVVILQDGTTVKRPFRLTLINAIFLWIYAHRNMLIRPEDFFELTVVSSDNIRKIMTNIYDRLLDTYPNEPHMTLVQDIWDAVNNLANYISINCQEYHQTVDILGLLDIVNHPDVKPLVTPELDLSQGTHVVEREYESVSKQLMAAIVSNPKLAGNQLAHFAKAGQIKAVQFPQNLIALGPRSDLDGSVPKHIIRRSVLNGMTSVADYGVESLAARKAMFYNKGGIQRSQYSARKLRICSSFIAKVHPGDCGNRIGIPMIIPKQGADAFLHNAYMEGTDVHYITSENLPSLIGKRIMLVSPTTCRHTDGVCEFCAGWGNHRATKYLPPDIVIGSLAASKLAGAVSQMILSNKHLSRTSTIVYTLSDNASRWFMTVPGAILMHPDLGSGANKLEIQVPLEAIGLLTDLDLDISEIAESYSRISSIQIYDKGNAVAEVTLSTATCIPYLSPAMLKHMKRCKNNDTLVIEESTVTVPMTGFDLRQPVFQYTPMSADMLAYASSIDAFFNKTISSYTSISVALTDFINLLFAKTTINMFFIQVIFKAFLRSHTGGAEVPTITDPGDVSFFNMNQLVPARSTCALLAFECVKAHFTDPESFMQSKGTSAYDVFYGEITCDPLDGEIGRVPVEVDDDDDTDDDDDE